MAHDYEKRSPGHTLNSPRAGSTTAVIAEEDGEHADRRRSSSRSKRRPMKPRRDEPHENVYEPTKSSSRNNKKKSSSSNSRKPRDAEYNDMDDASREAHIVQKIEMAIKKSKSERRADVRSQSSKRTPKDPPANEDDENYEMINEKYSEERNPSRSRSVHYSSSTTKREDGRRSKADIPLEQTVPLQQKKSNKYRKNLIDLDEQMDNLDMLDGIVDDKKGFQVNVEDQWLKASFSDPTLDTYEVNHFSGKEQCQKQHLNMLDPQRIPCGPGRSVAGNTSIQTGRDSQDPVISILHRINEKKGQQKGNMTPYTSPGHQHHQRDRYNNKGAHPDRSSSRGRSRNSTVANDERLNASELISFDHYEDNDGYYYDDDEDDMPIYPSSKPGLPQRERLAPSSLPEPELVQRFENLMRKDDSMENSPMQRHLDAINKLQRDIQRQQELIKEATKQSKTEAKSIPSPHETSAEVYQRELARQAQAELHRVELEQKASMLEKQMEIYKRNQEEWNKARKLAIKEEKVCKMIVEEAKRKWHEDMRRNYRDEVDYDEDDLDVIRELSDDSDRYSSQRCEDPYPANDKRAKKISVSAGSYNDASAGSSGVDTQGQSLYDKVAELNNRAEVTEEDQKIIEMEILKELHMELSKQAAEKKIMQKPLFFSDKLRKSWSGKKPNWANDPNIPVEVVTSELSKQIQQLGLEVAPSRQSGRSRKEESRRYSEGSKRRGIPLFKSGKSKGREGSLPPIVPGYIARERELNYRQTDSIPYDDDSRDRVSDFTSEPDSQLPPPKEEFKSPKRKLFSKFGFRKKDKNKQRPDLNKPGEVHGLIMSPGDDYGKRNSYSPQSPRERENRDDKGRDHSRHYDERSSPQSSPRSSGHYSQSKATQAAYSNAEQSNTSSAIHKTTESQSTQRASNKVYIGVNEDSIEAMNFTPRGSIMSFNASGYKKKPDPADDVSLKASSIDKYAALTGGNAKISPGLQKRTPSQLKKNKDEPALFEYLEVQYFPEEEEEEEEAPDDEIEADIQLSETSGGVVPPHGGQQRSQHKYKQGPQRIWD